LVGIIDIGRKSNGELIKEEEFSIEENENPAA
jgi:hypothetical protein